MFMRNPVPVVQENRTLLGFLLYNRQRPRENSSGQDHTIWFPVSRSNTLGCGFAFKKTLWMARQLQLSVTLQIT